MRYECLLVGFLMAVGVQIATAIAGDWPAFRGGHSDGISAETDVPVTWSATENIRWKLPLPAPGNSSPIVVGNRVFLTCAAADGKSRGLYCFDRDSGRELWARHIEYDGEEPTHETNPPCASSPAATSDRVVVWHGSAGAACYEHDGNLVWQKDLGEFRHIWGYASSPVIHNGRVYLNCGPGARTFVTCLDLADGETVWQTDEPGGDDDETSAPGEASMWAGSWSTPLVIDVAGQTQLVVGLPGHVQGYDILTGSILWNCEGLGRLVYTSPVVGGGICVAMGGYTSAAIGFRLGGAGDVTATNRLWVTTEPNPQRIGSAVITGPYLFIANEPGIVQCFDVETGHERWRDRLGGANIWGSLIAADGRMYVTNQEGTTYVLAPNPDKLDVIAKNRLDEASNSTPAFSNGQIFLRTFGHLYCIDARTAAEQADDVAEPEAGGH